MTPLLAQRPRTERAFERLYRHHVREIYLYAFVLLRRPDDAEAVTHTTFLNAYRSFQRGERPGSVRNWLIAIAHELCRQRFRREGSDLAEQAEEAVPDETPPTDGDLRRALGHLPFEQRAALTMRELEGRSCAEIAEILSVSLGEVETLLFRARRALREELEGTLTCHEAERAISRSLDTKLARSERRALRFHLRECGDCTRFAHSQRSQRSALRSLANFELPHSLDSFFSQHDAQLSRA